MKSPRPAWFQRPVNDKTELINMWGTTETTVVSTYRAVTEPDVAARMAEAYDAAERGDYPAALAIWGPLAQSGIARAQNNVGACFAEGLGIDRDPALALRWLTLAAEAGDPVGRRNLAALFSKARALHRITHALLNSIGLRPRLATRRRKTC